MLNNANKKYYEHIIDSTHIDVDMGEDFFDAITSEFGQGNGEIERVILANGGDAITSCDIDEPSYDGNNVPSSWDMGLIKALALEFRMKIVVLKKYDCDTEWSMTEDFEDIDSSKGLDVMSYFKDIEDATVFDTVDDVERAYNEYTDNLKEQYASDQDPLLDELTKAQKGKDKIVEQVKNKKSSDFVMICNDDADSCEVMHKFSTILYDGFNLVSYALGLVLKEE